MSSSPQRSPRTTPKTTPKRTPLRERSRSEANEISSRVRREPKLNDDVGDVFAATPFPTKPQQILLPSTLRKQKSSKTLASDVFGSSQHGTSRQEPRQAQGNGKRPAVRLKRSVKTLRDMYEAQAEESRPSTALTTSRPGTSNSRLRSYSSNEGLSGRYAWEQLNRISSDDLAVLPSIPASHSTTKRPVSQSSFASRAARHAATSSPNFRVLDATSSPRIPVFKDLSEGSSAIFEGEESDDMMHNETISSPNVVKLGRSSSYEDLPALSPTRPSARGVEASPARTIVALQPSSPIRRSASSSSNVSRKRKRSGADDGRSFAIRAEAANAFPSSPPFVATIAANPSSPPTVESLPSRSIDESSPVLQVLQNDSSSIEQTSITGTHASLQEAISSSPAAPVHHPIVRTPADAHAAGIVIPKRRYRASHATESTIGAKWPSRLSAPSQDSLSRSQNPSPRSSWAEVDDVDEFDVESLAAAQAYIMSSSANNSQIRMILDSDRHEGEDELAALPGDEYDYRSPPILNRSTSYLGSANSSQSRLASLDLQLERIKSYSHSRANSMRSFRPDSSSSAMSTVVVPTWARRYYSGFYPDSFRYLAPSTSNVNINPVSQPPPPPPQQRPDSLATTSRSSRQSLQSLRESLSERMPSIFRPKNRPRLEARKSHIMPGIGPLVSNPIREPVMSGARQARHDNRLTIRPVSFPLSMQDPRAHWNGIAEAQGLQHIPEDQLPHPSPTYARPMSADPSSQQSVVYYPPRARLFRKRSISPHLHHDHRLNTGSTASRGFGAPFNRKSYINAPSIHEEPSTSSIKTSRNVQITCFLSGFVLPFTWFVAGLLPLPSRPDRAYNIEKSHWDQVHSEGAGGHDHGYQQNYSYGQNRDADPFTRLKHEKRIKGSEEVLWQSARWWRTLNRWMSAVGVLVLILVIVLAVVGTRGWGG